MRMMHMYAWIDNDFSNRSIDRCPSAPAAGIDDSVVAGIFGASNPVRAQAEDVYV